MSDVGMADLVRRLDAVEHLAGVGFWEWRIQQNVTDWTDSLFRIFGYEPGEIGPSYETWLSLVHPDDREMTNELVQQAFAATTGYDFDHRIIWPTGEVRVLHCRGHITTDDAGEPTRSASSPMPPMNSAPRSRPSRPPPTSSNGRPSRPTARRGWPR